MQNLEWYLADLKSTRKNTIETVEKSLTDMFIRLVRIYPCLYFITKLEQEFPNSETRLFECYRQQISLLFSKHNSVLVVLMGQENSKCSGYNQRLFNNKISDIFKGRTKNTS